VIDFYLDGRGCGDFGADQGAVVHVPQTDCYKLLIGTLKKKIKIKEKGRIAANLNLLIGNR
jgi:hypothetical protein